MAGPVDTGRELNVLCTFNLRPLSTGDKKVAVEHSYLLLNLTH